MSFYVYRVNERTKREGWVGPIRSARQALRERDAWQSSRDSFGGGYTAIVHESSPAIRAMVRAWEKVS